MTPKDVAVFRDVGFLHLKGFFPEQEVDHLRHDAYAVFLPQMIRHGIVTGEDITETEIEAGMYRYFKQNVEEFVNCGKQVQHLLSLHRMSVDIRIEEVLRRLGLVFPSIAQRPDLYLSSRHLAKRESYWRAPPHQDWRSMQGSLDGVVVWMPLVDVDASLGALQVVPGSHKFGLLAEEFRDDFGIVKRFGDEDFVSIEMQRGDALLFSAFLVHRSGTNSTEAIRWSAQFRYNNLQESAFIQRGYPFPYSYKPEQGLVTPEFIPTGELMKTLWRLPEEVPAHVETRTRTT